MTHITPTDEASILRNGILVVDDDEDLLFAYRLLLEKENTAVLPPTMWTRHRS
ncbi:MAG: hypothetical protein ACERKS_06940 [Candidatus Bathyarchaeota archaeon]